MELNDQFYDDGIDLSDTEFDKAEDGNLKEISMPDFVNALMAGLRDFIGERKTLRSANQGGYPAGLPWAGEEGK